MKELEQTESAPRPVFHYPSPQPSASGAPGLPSPIVWDSSYVTADLNDDTVPDTVFAIIAGGKKGIRIVHGALDTPFILGAGQEFGPAGDDWQWLHHWHIVRDTLTYEQVLDKDGEVNGVKPYRLQQEAIYVGTDEGGGGTIVFAGKQYIWRHQAD